MNKNKYEKAYENFLLAVNCNAIFMDKVMWQDFETLKELVDKNKNYTLKEVKKMWKELGYEWVDNCDFIELLNESKEELFVIDTVHKKFAKSDDKVKFILYITFQEYQLLTKTFKALEVE